RRGRCACLLAAGAGFRNAPIDLGKLLASLHEFRVFIRELGRVFLDLSFEVRLALEKRAVISRSQVVGWRRTCSHNLFLLSDELLLVSDLCFKRELAVL